MRSEDVSHLDPKIGMNYQIMDTSNPCYGCRGQCCQNFLLNKMVLNHPEWKNILADIKQRYPYIETSGTFEYIEDANGSNFIPRLKCNYFNPETGLCTNHNSTRPSFCLNTGSAQYFSKDCQHRHQKAKKLMSKN